MLGGNKKILIVEDELAMLQILAERFTSEGFDILEAKDGKEGLTVALKAHPDLILLDIIMPKMDGITMLKKLRADNWGKDALVIILTNLSDLRKTVEALENNVHGFLLKSDQKLEDVVRKVKQGLGLEIK